MLPDTRLHRRLAKTASVRSLWSELAPVRPTFLPVLTAGLAAVGCVAQLRGCADGVLMPLQNDGS